MFGDEEDEIEKRKEKKRKKHPERMGKERE